MVPAGEFFGLLGPNGAGKTTLISAVCNLIRTTGGEARVFGHRHDSNEARRMVGLAEQDINLDRFLDVEETLVYHGGYYGMSRADARRRAGEMIDIFDLRAKATTRAPKLSGGMRRRLLLARALMHEPRLVILDEPTGGRRLRAAARAVALHPPPPLGGHHDPADHALPRRGRGAVRGHRADPRRPRHRARHRRRAARHLRRRLARRRLRQGDGDAVKLAIVGGGGFRVPLVYGALLAKRATLAFDEIVLHDVDAGRLERMSGVLHGLAAEHGDALPFRVTTDLGDAVEGADFVFCAIRVGRLEGRVVDESVPLGLGVLGQETTGPGGICFALRTIPRCSSSPRRSPSGRRGRG